MGPALCSRAPGPTAGLTGGGPRYRRAAQPRPRNRRSEAHTKSLAQDRRAAQPRPRNRRQRNRKLAAHPKLSATRSSWRTRRRNTKHNGGAAQPEAHGGARKVSAPRPRNTNRSATKSSARHEGLAQPEDSLRNRGHATARQRPRNRRPRNPEPWRQRGITTKTATGGLQRHHFPGSTTTRPSTGVERRPLSDRPLRCSVGSSLGEPGIVARVESLGGPDIGKTFCRSPASATIDLMSASNR